MLFDWSGVGRSRSAYVLGSKTSLWAPRVWRRDNSNLATFFSPEDRRSPTICRRVLYGIIQARGWRGRGVPEMVDRERVKARILFLWRQRFAVLARQAGGLGLPAFPSTPSLHPPPRRFGFGVGRRWPLRRWRLLLVREGTLRRGVQKNFGLQERSCRSRLVRHSTGCDGSSWLGSSGKPKPQGRGGWSAATRRGGMGICT